MKDLFGALADFVGLVLLAGIFFLIALPYVAWVME